MRGSSCCFLGVVWYIRMLVDGQILHCVHIMHWNNTPEQKKKQPTYKHFFFCKISQKKLRRGLWAPYPYSQFISKVDEFQIRLSTIMDYNIVFHMCIEVLWAGFFDHRITHFHPVFCQIMCYYIIGSSM